MAIALRAKSSPSSAAGWCSRLTTPARCTLEWDKLISVVATRIVEVVTSDGRRFLGSLGPADRRFISVLSAAGVSALAMADVTIIRQIGRNFWQNLDGSVDAGFNYTRSSGVAQLNFNSDTVYQQRASRARLAASLTITQNNDDPGRDDRGSVEASYLRYPWREWFIASAARFESNESLGLKLRSQIGAATGPRLVNSNRAQLTLGAGLVFNDERGSTSSPRRTWRGSSSSRPRSTPTIGRDESRHQSAVRPQPERPRPSASPARSGVKREFFKDLFVGLSLYNTYDNRPPNPRPIPTTSASSCQLAGATERRSGRRRDLECARRQSVRVVSPRHVRPFEFRRPVDQHAQRLAPHRRHGRQNRNR